MASIGGARRAGPRGRSLAARAALALAIVVALAGSWPAPAGAQGAALVTVTLHDAFNYGGASLAFTTGTASLVSGGLNDRVSAITVPAGGRVAVYAHTNSGGACEDFTASDPDLRNNLIGNDKISSLWVGKACPVRLHADAGFGGAAKDVQGDVPDLRALGFDDSATAFGVPAGTKVAVYEHPNYAGVCEELTASDPDLRGNPIGDDRITSLQVGKACPARATLYADRNYGGARRVVDFTVHHGVDNLFGFKDTASSIHVTGGLQLSGHDRSHDFGAAACTIFSVSDPDLSDDVVREDNIDIMISGHGPWGWCAGQVLAP